MEDTAPYGVMPAGRELDAAVLRQLFKAHVYDTDMELHKAVSANAVTFPYAEWDRRAGCYMLTLKEHGEWVHIAPSTSWHGMGLVVERMRELGWHYTIHTVEKVAGVMVEARFSSWERGTFDATAETAPHAVALAAIAAVGGE